MFEWFPKCKSMGITWTEFWEMNPNIIEAHIQGQKQEIELQNNLFHLNGLYTMEALRATVGNMFKKKGAKDYEYPEKPFELGIDKVDEHELTEEEKEEQTNSLFQMLQLMETNFNLSHGKREV